MKQNDTRDLDALRVRKAALAIDRAVFRSIGHRLVDQIGDFLEALPSGPVTPAESPEAVRSLIEAGRGIPESGANASELISHTADLLFAHSLFNGHPRFFGYITSSAAPIGMLADFLAASVNSNAGAWKLAPLATEIEAQTVRWIAEFIGYPADCGGLLVSGGNMANFVGLLAARTAKAGWDVRKTGLTGAESKRLCCYTSKETHTWIQKAADMLGLGTDSIRWIPTDDKQCMDISALEKRIHEDLDRGYQPFAVVGTAGSVSTGAVDALPQIAALCRDHELWFHIDGAYGGIAALVPGAPDDLRGLAAADSIAVDPHKWLYAPLEAGCALVRNPRDLLNTFSYQPPYYNFNDEAINYFDFGPQNSRGFRALKVWLALRQAGRAGYLRMIADDIRLARHLHSILDGHPEFEVFTQNLSITTFRYVPESLRSGIGTEEVESILNRVNQELLKKIDGSGETFLSNAIIDGRYALRVCVVNFQTALQDIEAIPEIVSASEGSARCRREKLTLIRKPGRRAGLPWIHGASSLRKGITMSIWSSGRSKSTNMKLLLLAVTAAAYAQGALSLPDAVRLAMERSKVIEASGASNDAAAARTAQARSALFPKVNYTESWVRSDNPVFVFSSLLAQRQFGESNFRIESINQPDFLNNFQSLLTADQPLYDAGKARRAVRTSQLRKDLAQEDSRRSQMEVVVQVVRHYYDVQLGVEQVKVTTQAMRSVEADLERAVARRSNGMATDADVLSIRVHIAAIHEEQIRRNAGLEVSRAAMNDAIGLPLDTGHTLTTPLAPLPLGQNKLNGLEKSAVDTRPEARQTHLAREIASVQAAEARSNYLPQVDLHGAFEADRQRFVYRGGANWLVSIGLRWNLFNGYADKARIAEGEAAVRRTAAEKARTESGIRLQVRQAWAGLKSAQERIELAQASVAEAEESLRISQNRFAAGLTTVTDLLRTETALLETQTRYVAAIHDQRLAAAMLEFAAGTLNADSEVLN